MIAARLDRLARSLAARTAKDDGREWADERDVTQAWGIVVSIVNFVAGDLPEDLLEHAAMKLKERPSRN